MCVCVVLFFEGSNFLAFGSVDRNMTGVVIRIWDPPRLQQSSWWCFGGGGGRQGHLLGGYLLQNFFNLPLSWVFEDFQLLGGLEPSWNPSLTFGYDIFQLLGAITELQFHSLDLDMIGPVTGIYPKCLLLLTPRSLEDSGFVHEWTALFFFGGGGGSVVTFCTQILL